MNSPAERLRPALICGLLLAPMAGCQREECPTDVVEIALEPRGFTWDDTLQLGVFRPNGQKAVVSERGDIPANAYSAVRVNLPDKPDTTPVPPPGLTWRVASALVDDPRAVLQTELQLRRDAYVVHAGNWAADIVHVRAHVLAETSAESEVAEGLEQRAETLKDALNAVSPSTGEEFEIPAMEMDRKLRFVWAQRPTPADFALDAERELERAIVVVSDCEACIDAKEWAGEHSVRVVTPEDPEHGATAAFFSQVVGQPMKYPMLWREGVVLFGFDSAKWAATLKGDSAQGEGDG
jgi:hypothetical protein